MATNLCRHGDSEPGTACVCDLVDAWKVRTPELQGDNVTVRGLQPSDATSLLELLNTEAVSHFLLPPPSTTERFGRFIEWTREEQQAGRHICFALVPSTWQAAAGLIQVRRLEPLFATAEWGFAVGQPFWGTGLFVSAATLVLEYLFKTVGVRRLEARTVVTNGRANGALEKLGARREGLLRHGFRDGDRCFDQNMWSILAQEWSRPRMLVACDRVSCDEHEPGRNVVLRFRRSDDECGDRST